jgi:NADH:ubiquinone oxidoreductase subunit 2 (subunit N)
MDGACYARLVVYGFLNRAVSVYYYLRVITVSAWGVLQLGVLPSTLLEAAGKAVIFLR